MSFLLPLLGAANFAGGWLGSALRYGAYAMEANRLLGPQSPLATGNVNETDLGMVLQAADVLSAGSSPSSQDIAKGASTGAVQGISGGSPKKSGFLGLK